MLRIKKWKISFNAPVILSYAGVCVAVYCLDLLTRGWLTYHLCSVYRSAPTDPLTYLRCLLHITGHASWDHLFSNMIYILLLGPMLEEKYGSRSILILMASTAVVTAGAYLLLFPGSQLLGASGVVFAMMLLSSFTGTKDGSIPLTFILVAAIFLIMQIVDAVSLHEGIAHLAHVLGGCVGAYMGFRLRKKA